MNIKISIIFEIIFGLRYMEGDWVEEYEEINKYAIW